LLASAPPKRVTPPCDASPWRGRAFDLDRGLRFRIELARALPVGERQRIGGAVGDLAEPHRRAQLLEILPRRSAQRRLLAFADRRRAVDHDGIGLAAHAGESDRFPDRVEIEHRRPRRDDDEGRRADGIADDAGHLRRGVDEHPFEARFPGGGDDVLDAARGFAQRRLAGPAQIVPQAERALRIGVDEEATPRHLFGEGGEIGGERALARAAFARCNGDDDHGAPPRVNR
jgi:hypothetical protein